MSENQETKPAVFVIGLTPKLLAMAAEAGYVEVPLPPRDAGKRYSIVLVYGRDAAEVIKIVENSTMAGDLSFPGPVEGTMQ